MLLGPTQDGEKGLAQNDAICAQRQVRGLFTWRSFGGCSFGVASAEDGWPADDLCPLKGPSQPVLLLRAFLHHPLEFGHGRHA